MFSVTVINEQGATIKKWIICKNHAAELLSYITAKTNVSSISEFIHKVCLFIILVYGTETLYCNLPNKPTKFCTKGL